MFFISGIHGVGKSYFCDMAKEKLGIEAYSASQLISKHKQSEFSRDKLIPDIDHNQQYLLMAVRELNTITSDYLLDGHFCLLNTDGFITRIPKETFIELNPSSIILLTEKSEIIAMRRSQRDGISHDIDNINQFQKEETLYAAEVAKILGIPLRISNGAEDLENTLDFIRKTMRR